MAIEISQKRGDKREDGLAKGTGSEIHISGEL